MTLRRRTLLSSALAGAGALAGCPRSRADAPRFAFVGPDPTRGHRVRAHAERLGAAQLQRRARVVIVGAGVAGLSAAWRLRQLGIDDVVVLELEDDLGGTARGGSLPRSRYPMGAHYLPVPRAGFDALEGLLADLDLVVGRDAAGRPEYDPTAIVRAPVERHRLRGLWHPGLYPEAEQNDDERAELERFGALLRALDRPGRDGRRRFDLPLARCSDDERGLDAITMATWLDRQGLDGWRVRWLCDYGSRDDFGCTLDQVSAFAGLHHFLARGLEQEHDRLLLSWPQGNAGLLERLAARIDLGERLRLQTAVLRIEPDQGRVTAVELADDRVVAWEADAILWAAPRFVLPHVLPAGRDPMPAGARTYAPWLVASLELTVRPKGVGAPLSWDNVAIDAPHLGYVVANHLESLGDRKRAGAVITFYEPRCADDPAGLARERQWLLDASADELGAHVLAAIDGMHPGLHPYVTAIDLVRWGHGMVRPIPGALFGPAAAAAAAVIGRVYPCAADCAGLPLFEQAFANGVGAAEHAAADLGVHVAGILG
ncbi:MAG: FAD-dependent oxidoreductase [Deltaproteobacteria bacterium]|nr:FAD-dependent oxidoreductase [Deltaproteobacteria bacterium]MBK8238446.1 FAD-dependent oxidoreductase [Deltaproteobacteria bacterium]MBP7291939.1 FAD-dependent oxidoreductase [Nannocystaceae bacterium]